VVFFAFIFFPPLGNPSSNFSEERPLRKFFRTWERRGAPSKREFWAVEGWGEKTPATFLGRHFRARKFFCQEDLAENFFPVSALRGHETPGKGRLEGSSGVSKELRRRGQNGEGPSLKSARPKDMTEPKESEKKAGGKAEREAGFRKTE